MLMYGTDARSGSRSGRRPSPLITASRQTADGALSLSRSRSQLSASRSARHMPQFAPAGQKQTQHIPTAPTKACTTTSAWRASVAARRRVTSKPTAASSVPRRTATGRDGMCRAHPEAAVVEVAEGAREAAATAAFKSTTSVGGWRTAYWK